MADDGLKLDLHEQLPPALTLTAFGKLIGVTPTRVGHMFKEGLPRSASGLIPRDEGLAWYRENVRPQPDAEAAERSDARQAARAERERHEAALAKLKLEERSGQLVSCAEVQAATFERARFERDAHLGFAGRLAAALAGELGVDQGRAFALIDRELRDHLTRLADTALPEPGA